MASLACQFWFHQCFINKAKEQQGASEDKRFLTQNITYIELHKHNGGNDLLSGWHEASMLILSPFLKAFICGWTKKESLFMYMLRTEVWSRNGKSGKWEHGWQPPKMVSQVTLPWGPCRDSGIWSNAPPLQKKPKRWVSSVISFSSFPMKPKGTFKALSL